MTRQNRSILLLLSPPKKHKKIRSRFWIVSTHVLTTGFAWPIIGAICIGILSALFGIQVWDWIYWILSFVIMTTAYIAGTYRSLSYLNRVAETKSWRACTIPSIITFCLLALISIWINALRFYKTPILLVGVIVFNIIISVIFAIITTRGFSKMDNDK